VPIIVQVTHIDPKKYMCTYMMMHESHRMKLNGGHVTISYIIISSCVWDVNMMTWWHHSRCIKHA
jgi:hypothetical protein